MIPIEWREMLHTLQQAYPSAVIAGGCLRDLVFGGAVKDIDVFVPRGERVSRGLLPSSWLVLPIISANCVQSMRGEVEEVDEVTILGVKIPKVQLVYTTFPADE